MKEPWRLVTGVLFALVAATRVAGQVVAADTKTDFVQALAQFSLGLEGAYGDEGDRLWSSLDAMDHQRERWDATIRTYETGMASEIGSAEPHIAARMHEALGVVYLDRSRVADALREFVAASQLDPSRADVYGLQGLAYSHPLVNSPAAATRAFRAASDLDPGDPVRAYVLARQLTKVGDLEAAKQALHLFEERQKRRADGPRAAVSSLFFQLGLAGERADVTPFFPPALYSEGFALLQRGDYSGAIVQFREAAARDPLTADAVETREAMKSAAAAFRDGSVALAVRHLKVAIALMPNRAEPHRILGHVYLVDQQYDRGVDELRTAVHLRPGDERARLALADAFVETDQYPAAEQALRETIEAVPASGQAHYTLGRLYQRQGHYPEALREFGAAVKFSPLLGLNGLYGNMAALSVDQQNFDAALDWYGKRVDLHPNDTAAHQDLGRTYARLNRDDEAQAEFSVVLMLNPAHADAYTALAQVHLKNGQYAEAAETARRALVLAPAQQQARYVLGTSLIRLGRTDEGKQELEMFQRLQAAAAATQAHQIELEGLKGEAVVSAANGEYERAVALLGKVLLYEPGAASSHLDLGLALFKAGRPTDALERFKTAVALNAPFEVHRHLAAAYAALGQLEESQREQAIYEQIKQENLRQMGTNR